MLSANTAVTRTVTIVLACSLLVLCLLVFASTRSSRQLWASYSPKLVRQLWAKDDNEYTAIDRSSAFRAELDRRVRAAAPADVRTDSQIDALTELVSSFLFAYSEGSFDSFWGFRAPSGRFRGKAHKDLFGKSLAQKIEAELQQSGITVEPDSADGDSRTILRRLWNLTALRQSREIDSNLGGVGDSCIICIDRIVIESIGIQYLEGSFKLRLKTMLRSRPNLGVFVYDGFIDALPKHETVDHLDPHEMFHEYIQFEVIIRSSAIGYTHPVVLVAGWDEIGKVYIPVQLGLPTLAPDRAFMIF